MEIKLELFGALRDLEPEDRLCLSVSGERVADLRAALAGHAGARWPRIPKGLLRRCAFATASMVLRDGELLPVNGELVVLPPVSGG